MGVQTGMIAEPEEQPACGQGEKRQRGQSETEEPLPRALRHRGTLVPASSAVQRGRGGAARTFGCQADFSVICGLRNRMPRGGDDA